MTLDEAIKYCEEEADRFEKTEKYRIIHTECGAGRYVEEHRQFADWLEELKDRRERTATTESASEKEKIKAEINGYFYGLNAAGKIDWLTYSTLYDVCTSILEKYYDRMEKERRAESEEETNRLQVGDKIKVQFGKETHFATAIQQRDDVMLFLTDDYLDDAMPMNPTDTTEGGWEGSALREKLQDIAKNTDIKDCLTPFENGDLLTLLSTREMFGLDEKYNKRDGQIEWLKDRWHRIAGRKGDPYERGWLRPVISGPCSVFVDDSGNFAGFTDASNALGVRPAFAIRIRDRGMIYLPFMNIWRLQKVRRQQNDKCRV